MEAYRSAMTWKPGLRAQWAQDAIDGTTRLDDEPEPQALTADALVDEAIENCGSWAPAHCFDDAFMEPLEVFTAALGEEADLHRLGRWATARYLRRLMAQRLALTAWSDAHPASERPAIDEPVFVLGAPRTGTTALYGALARLRTTRAPTGAEFLLPCVTSSPADRDVADEITYPQQVSTGLASIHSYSPEMPKECLSAMAFSARTEEFISRYHVPSYVRWLQSADLKPAYDMHRLVLEVLTSDDPDATPRRWVLKSPVHLQGLPHLVATYPDARFVVTHRNPASVLASVSSLIASLRSAFSDQVDAEAIGRYHLDLYSRSLNALVDHVDSGLLPPERTHHVHHGDIVRGPELVVREVAPDLGLAADQADGAPAKVRSRDAHSVGDHNYDAGDFGLAELDVDAHFGRYMERFGVPR
jgi:hypothetical protein